LRIVLRSWRSPGARTAGGSCRPGSAASTVIREATASVGFHYWWPHRSRQISRGTAESDWPPEVRALPVVTAPRMIRASSGASRSTARSREAIADRRSLNTIDEELIDALAPT